MEVIYTLSRDCVVIILFCFGYGLCYCHGLLNATDRLLCKALSVGFPPVPYTEPYCCYPNTTPYGAAPWCFFRVSRLWLPALTNNLGVLLTSNCP